MIYLDNSATTLKKPPQVAQAVAYGVENFGNPSRSFHPAAMDPLREIYKTRQAIADLMDLSDPLNVAFTSAATESLNLIIGGLIGPDTTVVTTNLEHNSVLRPLYLTGCKLKIFNCEPDGTFDLDKFTAFLAKEPNTSFFFLNHGSNVIGTVAPAQEFHNICKEHQVTMVLDVSQTLGLIPVKEYMSDIFCFTGHKGLFGPQGTGGIVLSEETGSNLTSKLGYRPVKTGGSGIHTFEPLHSLAMPDIFEVGTSNSHGIYGLQKGVEFILNTGIEKIHQREMELWSRFYNQISQISGLTIYGPTFDQGQRLPLIAVNLEGYSSSDLAEALWEDYQVATRPGSHCAPLLHQHFQTVDRGMVRFSISYFNTEDEIDKAAGGLITIGTRRI